MITLKKDRIEDIWILTDEGIVIFTTSQQKMDVQLFGGFLIALNQFAEVLTQGELRSIDVGIRKYYILKTANLKFVASALTTIKEKSIINQLNMIRSRFLESYPPEFFMNWNHNTSQFTSFSNKINDLSMMVIS